MMFEIHYASAVTMRKIKEQYSYFRDKFGSYEFAPFRTPYDKNDFYKPVQMKAGKRKGLKRSTSKPVPSRIQTASSRKSMIHKTASALKSKYSAFVSLKKLDSSPEKSRSRASEIKQKRTSTSAIKDEGKDSSEVARAVVNEKIKELLAKSGESEESSPEKKMEVSHAKDASASVSPEGKKLKQEKYIKSDIVDKLANKIQAIANEEAGESNEPQSVPTDSSKEEKTDNSGTITDTVDVKEGFDNIGSDKSDNSNEKDRDTSDSAEKPALDKSEISEKTEEKLESSKSHVKDQNKGGETTSLETAGSGQDSVEGKEDAEMLDVVSKSTGESPASKEEYRKKLESTILSCKAKLGMDREESLSDVSLDSSESEDESSSSDSNSNGDDDDDSNDKIFEKYLSEKSEESTQDSQNSESKEKNIHEKEEENSTSELEKAVSASDTSESVSSVKETETNWKSSVKITEETANLEDKDLESDKVEFESSSILTSKERTESNISPQKVDEQTKEIRNNESAMETSDTVSDQSKHKVDNETVNETDNDNKNDTTDSNLQNKSEVGKDTLKNTGVDLEQDKTSETSEVTLQSEPRHMNSDAKSTGSETKDSKSSEKISDSEKVLLDQGGSSKTDSVKEKPDFTTEEDKNNKDRKEKSDESVSKAAKIVDAYSRKIHNEEEKAYCKATTDTESRTRNDSPFESTGMLMEVDDVSDTDSDAGGLLIDLDADTSSPAVTHSSKLKESPNKEKDKTKSPVKKIKKTSPTKTALKEKILKNKPREGELKDSDVVMIADGLDSSPEPGGKKKGHKKRNIKECREGLLQALR